MKAFFTMLALGTAGACATTAQAQCFRPFMPMMYTAHHGCHSCCHHTDSCAAPTPFRPGRLGGYMGAVVLGDRAGTFYGGMELEGYYYVAPRLSMGLRGSFTAPSRPAGAPETYAGATSARLTQASITWNNRLLLSDQPRWRVALEGGAGLGAVSLYDEDQQVPTKGSCECTEAKHLRTATGLITEAGLAVTYKLKGDAPWLTLRGGRRQWGGTVPFGSAANFSGYVVSVGITLPDAPARRR